MVPVRQRGDAVPSGIARYYDLYFSSFKPTAWWKLADAVGSSTAADSSGNGYTGTVHGTVTFGQTGPLTGTPADTAALFDGSTGHIYTGLDPTGSAFSVMIWFKRATESGNPSLIASDYTAATNNGFEVQLASGTSPRIYIGNGTTNAAALGSAITDSNWHMVVGTFDGSTIRFYQDGVAGTPASLSGSMAPSAYKVDIASRNNGGADFFSGDIAQVAILNTVLTPTQIANLWAARLTGPSPKTFPFA